MNWQYLRYFEVVAREEHITRAANQLHITQSALSKSIDNLEDDVGVPLFESHGRNIRLTKYGQIFYEHVSAATGEIERGIQRLHTMMSMQGGEVTFATIFSVGAFSVPKIIKGFQALHPDTQLHLYQKSTSDILKDVLDGRADLGFVGEFPRSGEFAEIEAEPIAEEEILLAVPNEHPLASRTRPVEFRELLDENFVGWTGNTGIIHSIRMTLERAGLGDIKLRETYQGAEENCVASMVREGLGVALIADNPLTHREGLTFLHIKNPYFFRTLYLVWKKGTYLSSATKAFKYYVLSTVNEGK